MAINDTLLRDLLDFSDEQGVLSFYVGHTPAQAADPQPTAPIELRNQIKDLKSRLTAEDPDAAKAVTKRLEAINGELNALLDPKAHGQGRALFVGVADGRTASVSLQIPFRQRVVFHDGPFVRPLVSALDEGRSAGILIVSRSAVRLLRWAVGEVEELDSEEFTVGDAQLADIKSGPSHGTPANPNQGLVNKERFEDRIDENRNRFLRSVVDDVAAQAKEHGWDRVVLSGPVKLREFVGELLEHAATNGLRVVHAEADWEHDSPATIAQHVWPVLRSVHERREQDLVDQVVERAGAKGAATLGLREVCDALNEGRVAHLVFDDRLTLEGFRSSEDTLHPEAAGPVAQSDGVELHREPLFVERMIEKAISTGAQVTPISHAGSAPLGAYDGVGALLRW
jgi:peptide subunit release factor 1 (eRF1)